MRLAILLLLTLPLLPAQSAQEHYLRANALFTSQQFPQASGELDTALKLDPGHVPSLTLKAKLAMALNRFDIARACVERAVSAAPGSSYVHFLAGFFYYVDNDFARSIPALDTARKLKPDDIRTHFYLALAHEGIAQPDKAREFYEKTLALEAQAKRPSAETHVAYARMLFSQGEYEASERHIRRALQLDPASRDAHYETGRLHFERGDYKAAAAAGEQALSLTGAGTTDRQIHFLLGRAYRKLGDAQRSAKHLSLFNTSGASLRR